MILNNLLALVLWLLGMSVCIDRISLDRRMKNWETKNPGRVYIRRFRRL